MPGEIFLKANAVRGQGDRAQLGVQQAPTGNTEEQDQQDPRVITGEGLTHWLT